MQVVIIRRGGKEWVAAVFVLPADASRHLARAGGPAVGRVESAGGEAFPFFIREDDSGFSFPRLPDNQSAERYADGMERDGQAGAIYVFWHEWIGPDDGSDNMGAMEHYHFG